MTQRVFVDANVLFSKTQMDWLFFLKTENDSMFQLHATEDVFAEVASNMRKRNPRLAGHAVRNRVETMRLVVDEVVDTFPADLPFTGATSTITMSMLPPRTAKPTYCSLVMIQTIFRPLTITTTRLFIQTSSSYWSRSQRLRICCTPSSKHK